MTTPEWVFSRAIHLMDEQNESSGATSTQDTQEYRLRTLSILNVMRHELFPYSDTFQTGDDGKRAVCPERCHRAGHHALWAGRAPASG